MGKTVEEGGREGVEGSRSATAWEEDSLGAGVSVLEGLAVEVADDGVDPAGIVEWSSVQ